MMNQKDERLELILRRHRLTQCMPQLSDTYHRCECWVEF
jgi:hypothetical protein